MLTESIEMMAKNNTNSFPFLGNLVSSCILIISTKNISDGRRIARHIFSAKKDQYLYTLI